MPSAVQIRGWHAISLYTGCTAAEILDAMEDGLLRAEFHRDELVAQRRCLDAWIADREVSALLAVELVEQGVNFPPDTEQPLPRSALVA